MLKLDVLNRIRDERIIAIIRATDSDGLLPVARAIVDGGVSVLEVTMTTPNALQTIEAINQELGDTVCIGAGSVLDAETARLAILAGAVFIVTPVMDTGIIQMCNRYGIPLIMGCYTPTEAKTAWELGADLIKLFPISLGGVSYLKAVRAPLPQIAFVPTGGVDLDSIVSYLQAGAFAVGLGSSLVTDDLLKAQNTAEIKRRARAFRQRVQGGAWDT